MSKFGSVLKIIFIVVLVTLLVAFGIDNMHQTEIHFPFADAVEINVIFLFLIGLLLGAGFTFAVVALGRFNKKG
jgi:uncharacterized integral membrane protein